MMTNQNDRNAIFSQQSQDGPMQPSAAMPRRNVMLEDFGYEVPIESVPLPSGGVTYPLAMSLHGRDSVDIRSMTAKEEDILTSRALIKQGTVITHLLNNCIVTSGVNTDMMLSGDRNAVMVALRITGYGSGYNVEIACPACGEKSKHEFDLSALEVKRLQLEPLELGSNEFEFMLPVTKKRVRFKFMTGRDEQEIMKMQERLKKSGAAGNQLVTQRLQYAISSIEGITDRTKLQLFIQNMPARDSLELRRFIDEHEPGIDMSAWMDCPHCSESSRVRLPLGPSFFWPDSQ
jgi:hypothetical protein